jgi:hypothetical protein
VTTVVPLPVGKHCDSGSFASRLSPAAATLLWWHHLRQWQRRRDHW